VISCQASFIGALSLVQSSQVTTVEEVTEEEEVVLFLNIDTRKKLQW
jgi:hypothetical protein